MTTQWIVLAKARLSTPGRNVNWISDQTERVKIDETSKIRRLVNSEVTQERAGVETKMLAQT